MVTNHFVNFLSFCQLFCQSPTLYYSFTWLSSFGVCRQTGKPMEWTWTALFVNELPVDSTSNVLWS